MYTVLYAIYRKDGMSKDEFVQHYRDVHMGLAAKLPGVRSYQVHFVNGTVEARDEPDAFAVTQFDSEADFQKAAESPEMATAGADAAIFASRFGTYLVEAHTVV